MMRNNNMESFDTKLKEIAKLIKVQQRNWLELDRRLESS